MYAVGRGTAGADTRPETNAFRRAVAVHLFVQSRGDLLQRHPLHEHRVDLHGPSVVTAVADQMRQTDIVRDDVPSVRPEPRVVVGRRGPILARRSRVEVSATPEAVALAH